MRYYSRKFLLAAMTLLVNAGLLVTGNLTDSSYAAVTSAVLLAYMAANVAQKATAPQSCRLTMARRGPEWALPAPIRVWVGHG